MLKIHKKLPVWRDRPGKYCVPVSRSCPFRFVSIQSNPIQSTSDLGNDMLLLVPPSVFTCFAREGELCVDQRKTDAVVVFWSAESGSSEDQPR